jgi:putative NADPH-quinone reductase
MSAGASACQRWGMSKILIIDGHPDRDPAHFVHALADAYAEGAGDGHEVRRIALAGLDFPLIRNQREWMDTVPPPAIAAAQRDILWAEHLVFLYPLWLGDVPALLKGFLEQVARPGFAIGQGKGGMPNGLLKGRSARVIVTMGMPALFYEIVYRAHSLKSLERNILKFAGISPVAHTIVGGVEVGAEHRAKWLERVRKLGRKGA